jgi:hypothetical protein
MTLLEVSARQRGVSVDRLGVGILGLLVLIRSDRGWRLGEVAGDAMMRSRHGVPLTHELAMPMPMPMPIGRRDSLQPASSAGTLICNSSCHLVFSLIREIVILVSDGTKKKLNLCRIIGFEPEET